MFSGRPRAVTCHLCGREYGTASIDIHLKACEEKWLREEETKPRGQRRPLPQRPSLRGVGGGAGGEGGGLPFSGSQTAPITLDASALMAYNSAAAAAYTAHMAVCENCGRRFKPDRLPIHQKSCTPHNPARRVGEALPGGGGGAAGVGSPARGGGGEDEEDEEEQYGSGVGRREGGGGSLAASTQRPLSMASPRASVKSSVGASAPAGSGSGSSGGVDAHAESGGSGGSGNVTRRAATAGLTMRVGAVVGPPAAAPAGEASVASWRAPSPSPTRGASPTRGSSRSRGGRREVLLSPSAAATSGQQPPLSKAAAASKLVEVQAQMAALRADFDAKMRGLEAQMQEALAALSSSVEEAAAPAAAPAAATSSSSSSRGQDGALAGTSFVI